MQLLWLALALIGLLTVALVLLVAYGAEITDYDYAEPLLLIGLLAFVTCAVAYFADKEREQRAENQRLIRELHQTAQALDSRIARLNKLSETSADLAGALDIDRISELVIQALVDQVDADAASLVLLDSSRGEYVHRRSVGEMPTEDGQPPDPAETAKAAAEGTSQSPEADGSPEAAERLQAWERIRATITAPMKVSEVVGGALTAIRDETFNTEDLNLLKTLANMCTKAIESADLHQSLRQSYYRTLHVLARSLAARDPYSASHGEAVTHLALLLAKELALPDDAIEAIQFYGPLHDLGKIGIPDAILSKRGALTEEEFDTIRQHTVLGESIIRPLEPGVHALVMIRSHHERWDGAGYPDGSKGEKTPIVARVLAVADTFHAIVSHRSYRGGTLPAKAVQEIKGMSGTQFDPKVVAALGRLWDGGALGELTIRLAESPQARNMLDLPASIPAPPPRTETAHI